MHGHDVVRDRDGYVLYTRGARSIQSSDPRLPFDLVQRRATALRSLRDVNRPVFISHRQNHALLHLRSRRELFALGNGLFGKAETILGRGDR